MRWNEFGFAAYFNARVFKLSLFSCVAEGSKLTLQQQWQPSLL